MLRISLLIVLMLAIGLAGQVYAQEASSKTSALVSALDKTKYKKKEKANISIELYIDIKNEAAVKPANEYAGSYGCDGYGLDLQVERGGAATGSGYDSIGPTGSRANFTLRGAHIDGALLTATKVYDNGETAPFEAVFVNRTVSNGTNPQNVTSRDTSFGLGFIQRSNGDKNGEWTSRVFLERR